MSESMKTFLVVNPRSAGGATGKRFSKIAEQVRAAVGAFDHAFTKAPGDATVLCREALEKGYELVVGVGGDGTFNEVVGGFFDGDRPTHPEAAFGLVPQGTGGDLRKTVGIEKDLAAAAAHLAGTGTRKADVGLGRFVGADGEEIVRPFINIASFGIGGRVVDRVNRSSKALGGKLSFMIGSARALMAWKDVPITLRFDGGEPETTTLTSVAVCNGQYFGGGMWVAPEAKMDDGFFDVTIWKGYSLMDFAVKSKMVYDGSHVSDPRTRTLRAKAVEADSEAEVLIDLDGEQPGRLPARFEILPGAISLKV